MPTGTEQLQHKPRQPLLGRYLQPLDGEDFAFVPLEALQEGIA